MSAIAAIGAAAGAVDAGSGLIGSIANAVISGQKLDVQREALKAQIELYNKEYLYNQNKFKFDTDMAQKYYELAKSNSDSQTRLYVQSPALQAQAMMDAGFRNNLYSNGRQLTFAEVDMANRVAAERFYKPQITTVPIHYT